MSCQYDNTRVGAIIILSNAGATCFECNTHYDLPDGTIAKYVGHFEESVKVAKLELYPPYKNCSGCGKEIYGLQIICDSGSLEELFSKKEVEQDITSAISKEML